MKIKLLTGLLLAGSLALPGMAQAAPWSWTGTMTDWQTVGTVTDGDSDMQWVFESTSIPMTTLVTFEEVEIGGVDYYDVGFDFGAVGGYAGSGQVTYRMVSLDPQEMLRNAQLSITQTGNILPQVTKQVWEVLGVTGLPSGALLADLGVPPSPDAAIFAAQMQIRVTDTIAAQTGGVVQDLHNSYTIPEPTTLSLLGLSLLAMPLLGRRRV